MIGGLGAFTRSRACAPGLFRSFQRAASAEPLLGPLLGRAKFRVLAAASAALESVGGRQFVMCVHGPAFFQRGLCEGRLAFEAFMPHACRRSRSTFGVASHSCSLRDGLVRRCSFFAFLSSWLALSARRQVADGLRRLFDPHFQGVGRFGTPSGEELWEASVRSHRSLEALAGGGSTRGGRPLGRPPHGPPSKTRCMAGPPEFRLVEGAPKLAPRASGR